jgi:hypothetical protein
MTAPNIQPATLQAVLDWTLFTSADAKYRALVAVTDEMPLSANVSGYTDTLKLSEIESAIFGIDASDVPALYWAYERYENLIGSMDAYFGEFTDQERLDHWKYFRGERVWSFDAALGFMVNACDLPAPKCWGWLCKIMAANVRGGLYDQPRAN